MLYTSMLLRTHTHARTHARTHTHTHARTHTHIHTHTHTHTHTQHLGSTSHTHNTLLHYLHLLYIHSPIAPIKLSECELHFLATLSGCKASKSNVSCNDYCRHSKYRTYDGTCNNLQHSYYGASVMPFSRLLEADYENDINLPKGWSQAMHNPFSGPKPSARLISSSVLASSEVTPDRRYTLMLMQFGQFLDHDLDIAPTVPSDEIFRNGSKCSELCGTEPPCFPIMVPPNDTRIKTRRCISFTRSSAMCGSGSSSALVGRAAYRREQINDITSFTDASMVYGSNKRHADELRDSSYGLGKLKLGAESSPGKYLLPYDNKSLVDCQQPDNTGRLHTPCFLAGDIRVNEQVGLSSMHTIFAREHNRIAKSLSALNTHWGDEKLYQEARKIVGAEWQHIIYTEYLPIIVGAKGMEMLGEYKGYNASVNPTILNSFATAAYRFGHTQIMPFLPRLDENWREVSRGHLPLFKAFFSPFRIVHEGGIDPLLRGLLATPVKLRTADEAVSSVVTERLFQETHQVALDLAALNIQRARDHGLPGYNQFRSYCGLTPAESFEDLAGEIPQRDIREKLEQLYGHPDNIDLFVGGVLEKVVEGAILGPTFSCIIVEQFRRLRDGDRFFYKNPGMQGRSQCIYTQCIRTVYTHSVYTQYASAYQIPIRYFKIKSIVDSSVSRRIAGQALFKSNTSVDMIFLLLNILVLKK